MARYVNTLPTEQSEDEVAEAIESYLVHNGFQLFDERENIWKKGMGFLTGPPFIRFETRPGKVRVEAWIKFALLPFVYVGEMGIDGFFALIPKRMLKAKVTEIEDLIEYD